MVWVQGCQLEEIKTQDTQLDWNFRCKCAPYNIRNMLTFKNYLSFIGNSDLTEHSVFYLAALLRGLFPRAMDTRGLNTGVRAQPRPSSAC